MNAEWGDNAIVDVTGAFASTDKTVVNWEGQNYYQACGETVVVNEDESSTSCVKRVDHPGDIHEDYDGVRKTEIKGRMAAIVTFPLGPDVEVGFHKAQGILQQLKPIFAEQKDVLIYGAVRDKADQIIMILDGDG